MTKQHDNYWAEVNMPQLVNDVREWLIPNISLQRAQKIIDMTNQSHDMRSRRSSGSADFGVAFAAGPEEVPKHIRDQIPIEIQRVLVFSTPPRKYGMLHQDGDPPRLCSFNIPLTNYEGTGVDWFESRDSWKEGYSTRDDSVDLKALRYGRILPPGLWEETELEQSKIVSRLIYQTSTLINTGLWHRTENLLHDEWRHVASIRFAGNPSFKSALEILRSKSNPALGQV
jgi:hypothetical protein